MPTIRSVNPATEETNREFETITAAQALGVCKESRKAFESWRKTGLDERLGYLRRFSEILKRRKSEYAGLATLEIGRPVKEAENEVDKAAAVVDSVVNNAHSWLGDEPVKTEFKSSYISFEPIGVVLAIMPWNFPYGQVVRCAAPALAVGNTVVLKHSNTVPICAVAIEEAFREAGLPENVFRTIITDHDSIPRMIRSRYVDGVSLTGSFGAGKSVAKLAGSSMKKCVMELGGSNPFIVLADADIDAVAKKAVDARIPATGQSCSSSKRFIVMSEVADEFTRKAVEAAKNLKVGDPKDSATQIGPLANAQQLRTLEEQVQDAIKKGAKVECGGTRFGNKGYFYQPTVLTSVKKNMRVMKEEVFGPVMPIISVKSEEQAIKIANDSDFGLGASVWTKDAEKGERIARRMEAGMACVNRASGSEIRMPFGGVKKSGVGREFTRYGMLEFANIKSVIVAQ